MIFRLANSRYLTSGLFTVALILAGLPASPASAANPAIVGSQPGSTPFIAFVSVQGLSSTSFKSASFSVATKPGGSAAPVSAAYTKKYLINHSYYTQGSASVVVPVFGLYQDWENSVQLRIIQGSQTFSLTTLITTAAWGDGRYLNPIKHQSRNQSVALSYSYFMLKNWDVGYSPTIMDVDGELRWVGNTPDYYPSQASTFQDGSIYYGSGTSLLRQELDGTYQVLKDYYNTDNVTYIGHHNYDKGKRGILLEVDRTTDVESAIIEVDNTGKVLTTFDLNKIIEDAIIAGGEDPSNFVRRWADWFHNNAAAYWKKQNTLVVSSRENFVIGIDYDSKKIKWILGDPTKYWYTYSSLRKFALRLMPGTLPPIGQHAVSITSGNELLLFDNGTQSFNQPGPAGESRGYAAPRRYRIDVSRKTAVMSWSFEHSQNIYSPICSSIYEDGDSYLIDYASVNWGANIRLIGIDKQDRVAFDYELPGGWGNGWNAQPIHLEKLSFSS